MTTGTLALIIFAAILAQVAVVAAIGLRRRRRQFGETAVQPSEPRIAILTQSAKAPIGGEPAQPLAWNGFKDFIVQRRVLEDGNQSVCSFYLVPADGKPLPTFNPGQYLTFKLQLEDPVTRESKTVVRCYSLSDRARPDCYRVTIKRIPPPADAPDTPPGLSSNYFHAQVREGTRLLVKAPSGHFYLLEDEPLPIVLVAGGIGITPMLSILNNILQNGRNREVWLYLGVRNGAEHIMKEHLNALQKAHTNFHLRVCYSRPGEGDVEGVDYHHRGHVDIQLLRSTLKLMRYQFYVCGPKPMMETLVPALEDWGVAPGDIRYESFGPASLVKHEKPALASAQVIQVRFNKTGKTIPWDPSADSLLEFAEANGIAVESGCRAGSCGSCQTRLEAGEVEYNQRPDADAEPGHCLLCIATPKGDLTLTA